MVLKEKEVWNVTVDDIPATKSASWKKDDEKAFATIAQSIEDSQI